MERITFKVKCRHCGKTFEALGELATICGKCLKRIYPKKLRI